MAKKKAGAKRTDSVYPFSWQNIYCLPLKNSGAGDDCCTFGVLRALVQQEIARVDKGESDLKSDADVKALLIIRELLDIEFFKYEEA
jgi:hypothetical protein